MLRWFPPTDWRGQTVAILGGGPSVADEDLTLLAGRPVVGVNSAYLALPECPVLFFGDERWAREHVAGLRSFAGELVTSTPLPLPDDLEARTRRINLAPGSRNRVPAVMHPDPGYVAGADSGARAINLVAHGRPAGIVLIGFDMRFVGGRSHWHVEHATPSREEVYRDRYLPQYARIVGHLEAAGITAVQTSSVSAITAIPRTPLSKVKWR